MRRRDVLATAGSALGVGLAGCSALEARTVGRYPDVSVVDTTDASPHGFEFDVAVLSSFSESSPARLEISLWNVSDREQSLTIGQRPPYSGMGPEDESAMVLLADDPQGVSSGSRRGEDVPDACSVEDDEAVARPDEPIDGCWRLCSGFVVTQPAFTVRLAPDEQIAEQYSLYASPSGFQCLPAGTYRFEESNYFPDGSSVAFALEIQ